MAVMRSRIEENLQKIGSELKMGGLCLDGIGEGAFL
jgi:hypothetical protein